MMSAAHFFLGCGDGFIVIDFFFEYLFWFNMHTDN